MGLTEQEFNDHLRKVITNFESDYRQGAWENFQQKEQEAKPVFNYRRLIMVAAAVLMLISYGVYQFLANEEIVQTIPLLSQKESVSDTIKNLTRLKGNKEKRIVHLKQRNRNMPPLVKKTNTSRPMLTDISPTFSLLENVKDPEEIVIHELNRREIISEDKANRNLKAPFTLADLLALSANEPSQPERLSLARKWSVDFGLSSDYGPVGKVGIGFGSSIALALNRNLSVSAGVRYLQVSGRHETSADEIPMSIGKSLSSVETIVRGLDVPIDLKYNLSNRSFLSFGISAMGVLKTTHTLNYLENKLVEVTVAGPGGPVEESQMVTFSERVTATHEELPRQSYLGFYNLSYGFKQKLGDHHLVLEPYIKIPMKRYAQHASTLTSSGIRLQFSF